MYGIDAAQLRSLTPKRLWNLCKLTASYCVSCLTKKAWITGYPAVLSIEPTNNCNLKCPQCPTGAGTLTRPTGYMDTGMFREIIDAAKDYTTHVQFYFQGEPFLHKNLPDMIAYARSRNMYTLTSTNGHYLNISMVTGIIDAGLDALVVGLDGISPEVYREYRKSGSFDKVVNGIKLLVDEREKRGRKRPKIYLQFIVMKNNENEVAVIREFGRKLNVDKVLIKTAQVYPGIDPDQFLPKDSSSSRYVVSDGKPVLKTPVPNRCRRLWTTAVITWDGRFASCCFDKDAQHAFGIWNGGQNLDAWQSEKSMKFRNAVLRNRSAIPMCMNCTEGIREFL